MSKPLGDVPSLPKNILAQIADKAGIPKDRLERDYFLNGVDGLVKLVWASPRRGPGAKRSAALTRAAVTARKLHRDLSNLNKEDREGLKVLLNGTLNGQLFGQKLSGVQYWTNRIAGFLTMAADHWPGALHSQAPRRGRKRGAVGDWQFQGFVKTLLIYAQEYGGSLTLQKNVKKGTLIESLNMLGPHLPNGFIPKHLPLSTLQRIKRVASQMDLDALIDEVAN
jgi:hypothetical protein